MITYAEYMKDSSNLHHDYYIQFVNNAMIMDVPYSVETIKQCLQTDKNLNNLPSGWMDKLDGLTLKHKKRISEVNTVLQGRKAGYSLSQGTCIFKAIMREIAEGNIPKGIDIVPEEKKITPIEVKEEEPYKHSNNIIDSMGKEILSKFSLEYTRITSRPDKFLDDMPIGSIHYECIINGHHKPFYYSKGPACNYGVTIEELFYSLLLDASSVEYCSNFGEFCDEFGYDSDSRKAYSIYSACLETLDTIKNTFSEDERETLHRYFEEY